MRDQTKNRTTYPHHSHTPQPCLPSPAFQLAPHETWIKPTCPISSLSSMPFTCAEWVSPDEDHVSPRSHSIRTCCARYTWTHHRTKGGFVRGGVSGMHAFSQRDNQDILKIGSILSLSPHPPPLTCHTDPAHGDVERDGNKLVIQQKIAEDLTVAIESIPNSMVTLVKHLSK